MYVDCQYFCFVPPIVLPLYLMHQPPPPLPSPPRQPSPPTGRWCPYSQKSHVVASPWTMYFLCFNCRNSQCFSLSPLSPPPWTALLHVCCMWWRRWRSQSHRSGGMALGHWKTRIDTFNLLFYVGQKIPHYKCNKPCEHGTNPTTEREPNQGHHNSFGVGFDLTSGAKGALCHRSLNKVQYSTFLFWLVSFGKKCFDLKINVIRARTQLKLFKVRALSLWKL